jgi:hypothetical protein
MTQKIGMEAVLLMSNFNKGKKDYEGGMTSMGTKTSGFAKVLSGLGTGIKNVGIAAGAAAIGGIAALTGVLYKSIQAAAEAQAIDAQLDAVLKATGSTAGMTKEEIIGLADALSTVTPFEDDLIISTETMLLQFKNIGEKVFPQATEMALDLATRLGIDAVSAAKLLGKALEAPGEGLLRLKQAGIAFTDEQQKMIDKMVLAGDTAGAQKYIMDELEKSIGGAAKAAGETFAGKLEILKNKFGNLLEAIGGPLLPILSDLLDLFSGITDTLTKGDINGALAVISEFLGTLGASDAIIGVVNTLTLFFDAIKQMATGNGSQAVADIAVGISGIAQALGIIDAAQANELALFLYKVGLWAGNAAKGIAEFITEAANAAWQPFAIWFKDNGKELADNLLDVAGGALELGDNIGKLLGTITDDGPEATGILQTLVQTGLNQFSDAVSLTADGLARTNREVATFLAWLDQLKGPFDETYTSTSDFASAMSELGNQIGLLGQPFSKIKTDLQNWNAISEWLTTEVPKAWAKFNTWAQGAIAEIGKLPAKMQIAINASWEKIQDIGKSIVDGIKKGIENSWDAFVKWILDKMGGIIDSITTFLGIGSPAKMTIPIGESMVQGIQAGWNKALGGLELPSMAFNTRLLQPAPAAESRTVSTSYGGDTYYVTVQDRLAAAVLVSTARDRQFSRLAAGMGG